jgi:hypothetical protein
MCTIKLVSRMIRSFGAVSVTLLQISDELSAERRLTYPLAQHAYIILAVHMHH